MLRDQREDRPTKLAKISISRAILLGFFLSLVSHCQRHMT